MEITVQQQIYYSNKDLVPLKDIGESLIALQSLIERCPEVLEAIFPDTKVLKVEVFLNELKSGSIYEDLFVKLVFGDQQRLDELISNFREKIGLKLLMDNPKILGTLIAGLALGAALVYVMKDPKATETQKATIQANHNTIINIGADNLKMNADDLKNILNTVINGKDKNKVAKEAVAIIKPAKKDSKAFIRFNEDESIKIENKSIQAIPSVINDEEPEEYIDDINNLELEIRATDIDSAKRGWAVVAPSLDESRRVKLHIDPTIKLNKLRGKSKIQGNVTVIYGHKEGKKYPKLIFLRELTGSTKK